MITLGELLFCSAIAAACAAPLIIPRLQQVPDDVSLAESRRTDLGLPDYLPFEEHIEPDLMLLSNGALGVIYEVYWEDTSVMSDDDRVRHCVWLNDALYKIGAKVSTDDGWMSHTHYVRVDPKPRVTQRYASVEGRILDESHNEHVAPLRQAARCFLSFAFLPPSVKASRLHKLMMTGETEIETSFEKNRAEFLRGLDAIEDSLRMVGSFRRLGEHPEDPGRSELLETLFGLQFDEWQPIAVPVPFEPAPVGALLSARDIYPAGIRPKIGDKHLRVLSVFAHPSMTNPAMLDALLKTPGRFRFSTRMIFQDSEVSKKKLAEKKRKWSGKKVSLLAAAMPGGPVKKTDRVADFNEKKVDDAMFLSSTTKVSWVHFSAKVVFFNEDLDVLNDDIRNARKALQDSGFTVNLETQNTLDAYFGHIPFDGYHDVREGLAHSFNVSRIWASSSRWSGRSTWKCKNCGPRQPVPTLTALTDTGEDFFFDPHDGEDRQSFIALGDSGAGKSTFLNTLSGQYLREPTDQSFGFDCNYSQFVTCAFLGGKYHERMQHWLFGGLESPERRQFLAQYLCWVVELNGGFVENRKPIMDALENMLEDDVWNRTLSSFIGYLNPYDKDSRIVQTLAEYDNGGIHRGLLAGTYQPDINTNPREVYELGHLLGGNTSERAAAPALIWLIKTLEDRLPGARSMIFFDEAWAGLNAVGVAPLLEKLLLTIRFRHGGIGMFAQNPDHILKSPIGRTIRAVCDNTILFPTDSLPRDLYASEFGRNDAQIDAIRNGTKKRDFAVISGGRFGMARLHLSPAQSAVYGCTSRDEVDAVKALIIDHPDTWRERHWELRGCRKEAAQLRALRRNNIPFTSTSIKEAFSL